jgi:hypothetical protein
VNRKTEETIVSIGRAVLIVLLALIVLACGIVKF